LSDQAIVNDQRPRWPRAPIGTPLLVAVVVLGALALSPRAQAAGASAMGWGSNYYGQTGIGAPTLSGCECILSPAPVSGLTDATQIAGGSRHSVALHADGTVTAWGYNEHGQLGDGTRTKSATPVPVGGLANVVAVAASFEHSLALLANGTVMAWGDNEHGELGLDVAGPETCSESPCSKTPVTVPGLSDVVAIDTGYKWSLALRADGTVWAWGDDQYGQSGNGAGVQSGCECVDHPVQVPGLSGVMTISAGDDHGAALHSNGTVSAWGENYNGQMGNGTPINTEPPACYCLGVVGVGGLPVPVFELSAGGYHNLVVFGSGDPQAWGYDDEGQLGNGTTVTEGCQCIPSPVSVPGLAGMQSVVAGGYHTIALFANGSAKAWGMGSSGQVGDGTEEDRSTPVGVSGLAGASDVSAGEYTSFALIGPSHTLTVELTGAGAGTVGGPEGIICPVTRCSDTFPDARIEILRAEPSPGSGFAGFTGPCTGTGACQVKMDADKSVTATFGPPKGTKITKAKITQGKKPKKKGAKRRARATASAKPKPTAKAKFSFSAPGAVTGYQCKLVKPKPKKKGKKAKKPKKPKFSSCKSPKTYKKLKKGKYTFKVRAKNILGVDAKPAVKKFKVKR
jgi:alpha-tubulin suppressor-like RCC1 family protein